MLTATSCCGSLAISSSSASSEPATSALTTRLSSLTVPSWASLNTSSSETLRPERRASASVFRRLARSPASWRARRSFSTTRTISPASGTPSKPSTSTGCPGVARLSLVPMKSCIARTRPKWAPATSASPTRSVPRWISTVTTGPRPGSSLDSITVPDASALLLAFSSSRSVTTWIVSSSPSRPWWVFALTSTNSISPPHSAGCKPCWVISVRTRSGCAPSLSILLTATMIGTSRGARVVDRLLGLRLHAVVGSDHDHREVGHARAAGAHRRERLVARRVEEGDLLLAVVHLVGADVLGDAASLARRHLGRADRVQQRGLAVVDVAHDRDHRRAFDHVLLGVLEGRLDLDVVRRVDDLDLLVELVREHLDRLVGERLRERRHLAERHQLLDDLRAPARRGTRRRP